MRNFIALALFVMLFIGCSDDVNTEETLDYTSYVITGITTNDITNAATGYFDKNGKCKLIHELGNLKAGVDTEEFILPEFHQEIYLFWGKNYDIQGVRLENPFKLEKNKKNTLQRKSGGNPIRIINLDIYNWPH